jgi:hypothetical protein
MTSSKYKEDWPIPDIKGTNCILKPWTDLEWAPILAKHANNPKIAANLPDHFPHPYTEQNAVDYISGNFV